MVIARTATMAAMVLTLSTAAAREAAAQQAPVPAVRARVHAVLRDTVHVNAMDDDRWFARDKAKHFAASAIIQLAASFAFRSAPARQSVAIVRASAVTLSIGAGKQLWDRSGHGDASWKDFTWDGIGILTGSGLAVAVDRRH